MSCLSGCLPFYLSVRSVHPSLTVTNCLLIPPQRRNNEVESLPVEVQTKSSTGKPSWKIGACSFDPQADTNLISQRYLITLDVEAHPLDKEQGTSWGRTALGRKWPILGYAQIVWTVSPSREVHSTRFLVVNDDALQFDLVLGNASMQEHRLNGGYGQRRRGNRSLRKRCTVMEMVRAS